MKAKNASTCWNHIKSSSENAFNIRKKCEQVTKYHCQLDTDVMKLTEKKKYLENLVVAEKRKFGNIKERNTEAHIKMRNMQRDLARKAVDLVKTDHKTCAMAKKCYTAEFLEYDIDSKAGDNLTAIRKTEAVRRTTLGIQNRSNLVR